MSMKAHFFRSMKARFFRRRRRPGLLQSTSTHQSLKQILPLPVS
jgi:hypothetical protein